MAILLESGLVCSQCNKRVEEVVRYSKSEESRAMRSRGRETQSKQPTERTDVIRPCLQHFCDHPATNMAAHLQLDKPQR